VRQARYFGRIKTLFQLLMAATVANLALVATRTGLMRDRSRPASDHSSFVLPIIDTVQGFFRLLIAPAAPRMPLAV